MAKKKNAKAKKSQICIVTVTGKDKVGIIAALANAMAQANINIVDVQQRIMEDYFVMTMACDLAKTKASMQQLQNQFDKIGSKMKLNITFQHEKIFKMMHRI